MEYHFSSPGSFRKERDRTPQLSWKWCMRRWLFRWIDHLFCTIFYRYWREEIKHGLTYHRTVRRGWPKQLNQYHGLPSLRFYKLWGA